MKKPKFEMVAIMGRGIQMLEGDADPTCRLSYTLTGDLEVCDERSAHLPVQVPEDDESPFCMVGGGMMNFTAGCELIRQFEPRLVVAAYGGRSDYLELIHGPSESEVMSTMLEGLKRLMSDFGDTAGFEIAVWPRDRKLNVASNTGQEMKNILLLAAERQIESIAIVTVGVHVPRTSAYISKLMSTHPERHHIRIVVFESEEVLLAANCEEYAPRVEALRKSKSFARSWERETIGISKIVRDAYGDAKPKVEVSTKDKIPAGTFA